MKRALAERAKQSAGLPSSNSGTNTGSGGILQVQSPMGNPASPGSPGSHSMSPDGYMHEHGRPLKIPRRMDQQPQVAASSHAENSSPPVPAASAMSVPSPGEILSNNDLRRQGDAVHSNANAATEPENATSQSIPSAGASAPASASTAANPPSMKRQRPVSKAQHSVPSDDEADENQQAFFLKHQNRALSSELKALQFQLCLLENERSYRRQQCRIASQALNSLQATWTQMETELHQPQQPIPDSTREDAASFVNQDAPMSTGSGARVELVGALFDALASLANNAPPIPPVAEEENGEDDEAPSSSISQRRGGGGDAAASLDHVEKQQLDDLSNISRNILQRATTLEKWIRALLRLSSKNAASSPENMNLNGGDDDVPGSTAGQKAFVKEIGMLRGQCREYKIQIAELAKARDDIAKSERKVRRSIYRLSTGRVKIDQVLKDMEKSDEDGNLAAEAKMEALDQDNAAGSLSAQQGGSSGTTSQQDAQDGKVKAEPGAAVNTEEVLRLRKQLEEFERQLATRDKSLQELQEKLTEREQRINTLCARELSEDDTEKALLNQKSQKRLEQIEEELSLVKDKLKETRENWAKARGDAEAAIKALEDLQTKQKKRWAELTGVSEQSEAAEEIKLPLHTDSKEQALKIIELDHKLKQALENVRQADAVRQNLKEALSMNNALQGKLEEIKGKYAALQAGRSNSSSNSKSAADATNHGSSSAKSSDRPESSGKAEKSEKMHREHRRMRKELAALSASKDAAKSKLERAEKERDGLMETNARLLRQSAEKDDMNAKSLSTILHLKNLTEQLTQGKLSLEQQLKNVGQLSLAARLATNAKDRVAEEIVKEKQAIEKKLAECEGRNEILKKELETTVSDWSEADAKISILNLQLTKSTKRSDELVQDLEREQKERRKLQDSLDVAVRKAGDAADKLNELAKREGGGAVVADSAFSVEQLNTQVSVLKSRLACPVCHYRDKDCIIMRCRHMFCKHCVDENIQNRSRKCPSCGLKFSEKDVDDVWL